MCRLTHVHWYVGPCPYKPTVLCSQSMGIALPTILYTYCHSYLAVIPSFGQLQYGYVISVKITYTIIT